MAVMDVVVDTRLMTLPVITSVMVMRYSVTTPFTSLAGGGPHDSPMDVELAGVSTIFWGGAVGAEMRQNRSHKKTIAWRLG